MTLKMADIRGELMDTLQKLKNGEIDVHQAKAVKELGSVLVASAKVEVDAMRVVGAIDSEFLEIEGEISEPVFLPRQN